MERLSLIDQALYKVTTSGLPSLNMQGAMIFDPKHAPARVTAKTLAEHLAARLDGVAILRKKLVQDPLRLGDLRLVDDAGFDVWNHIGCAALPAPGDLPALRRHLGRFSAQGLDLDRPLWRFEIIDGLRDGRLAVAMKLSHATMDGMAAMRVLQCIFDDRPRRPGRYKPVAWSPEPEPTRLQLLGSAARENIERIGFQLPRLAGKLIGIGARSAFSATARRLGTPGKADDAPQGPTLEVRSTSLNGTISTDRRHLAFATFELDALKALCRAMDCKLNDLCMLFASEALRTYFEGIGESIDFDLVIAMPLDMRKTGDKEFGNALSLSRINLHNTIPTLPDRLRAIRADTSRVKAEMRGEAATDGLPFSELTAALSPLALDVLGYALHTLQPWDRLPVYANCVFSNVRGPSEQVYVAGMPLDAQIPMIPVFPPGALTIGGASIANGFTIGFHACGKVVREENMQLLVDGVEMAYRELARELHATRSRARRKRGPERSGKRNRAAAPRR